MIDLEIRCDVCDRVPARFRLNNATVCGECARAAIDRACAPVTSPAPTPPDLRTPDEVDAQLLAIVRATDGPVVTRRLRNTLRVGMTTLASTLDRLVTSGALVRTPRGYQAAGAA